MKRLTSNRGCWIVRPFFTPFPPTRSVSISRRDRGWLHVSVDHALAVDVAECLAQAAGPTEHFGQLVRVERSPIVRHRDGRLRRVRGVGRSQLGVITPVSSSCEDDRLAGGTTDGVLRCSVTCSQVAQSNRSIVYQGRL